jgi:hypothetical protein
MAEEEKTDKPKTKIRGFKPKSTKIVRAPDEPLPQALETDITTSVPKTTTGPTTAPGMFKRSTTMKVQVQPAQPPPPPKRINTTLKATKPKPASMFTAPIQMAPKPLEIKEEEEKSILEVPSEPVVPEQIPSDTLQPVSEEQPVTESPCKRPIEKEVYEEEEEEEDATLLPSIATYTSKVSPELVQLQKIIDDTMDETPYTDDKTNVFVPEDRRSFTRFIVSEYSDFKLPPILSKKINPKACDDLTLQTYKYQAFVREYMRQASPYRGVLVYHGLGSGKTCTSIATAEALYSQSDKKIIVMTPISLKENFLNEIMFCGFRHYRLKNVWVSFSIKDASTRLFATSVLNIPQKLLEKILRRPEEQRVIWMPDLTKPDGESNFEQLENWKTAAIREQLYAVLQNKITFIGYTGFTSERLKEIATTNPTFFDDAVIIIDEVHNLTRLMAGKLDTYLTPGKKYYEPIEVDSWKPKQMGFHTYSRAYLFYRLLSQAKNSKIVALSGTPIVNQPVEIGILFNILHGYFNCVNTRIASVEDSTLSSAKELLKAHPRVNFFEVEKSRDDSGLFFTILDDGYVKVFEGSELKGVRYVGVEEAMPSTIQELYREIKTQFEHKGITLKGQPSFEALPLLPPTSDVFKEKYIDENTLSVKDRISFTNRISGLVSYYRGSKEELMPKVISDTIVECPFSSLALPQYEAVRLREIDIEKSKKSKKSSALDEALTLATKESTSYRFRSRALCNLAFPKDIERPFPRNEKELKEAASFGDILLGDAVTDVTMDAESVVEAEKAEKEIKEQETKDDAKEDAKEDELEEGQSEKEKVLLPYKERLENALKMLDEQKEHLFRTDAEAPENEKMGTYSSKFLAIYERIMASAGSSLVYSNFKTVEGIGVFGMALEANGFMRIEVTGPETDLRLTDETIASLKENPKQPRYILYSGDSSIRIRQTFINLFNYGRAKSKLPSKIRDVLEETELDSTGNLRGEICRVFMITGAGAEGLSLRNVRSVHIMEPYWNKVRTEQVKGRAVRICSHSDLPYSENPEENQRTVEVFTYIATFDPKIKPNVTIQLQDNSKTSDQYIESLANAKEKVSNDILSLLKAGAVDCVLNKTENEQGISCFVQTGSIHEFLYDPRFEKDSGRVTEGVKEKEYIYAIDDILYETPLGELTQHPITKKPDLKLYTK